MWIKQLKLPKDKDDPLRHGGSSIWMEECLKIRRLLPRSQKSARGHQFDLGYQALYEIPAFRQRGSRKQLPARLDMGWDEKMLALLGDLAFAR